MVVYLDVIFAINLCIDAAALYATSWSRKLQAKPWRIWAAAAIGASYVVMMFFPALSGLFTFFVKVLFSLVMVWTAFGFISLQYFLRNLGAFYFVNFVAAGCIFALHYLLQSQHAVLNGIFYAQSGGMLQIGLVFIAAAFVLSLAFYKTVIGSLRKTEQWKQYTAQIEVSIEECTIVCAGLIDTGNRLYEPLTRTPVMIMEAELWREWLPENLLNSIRSSDTNEILDAIGGGPADKSGADAGSIGFRWRDRLRLVPYKGVNSGTSFLLALKPDEVVIHMQDQRRYVSKKVLVGLQGFSLSAEGAYRGIIHPDLIDGNKASAESIAG